MELPRLHSAGMGQGEGGIQRMSGECVRRKSGGDEGFPGACDS